MMKKMLIVVCLIGLMASSAWAYPGPNSMGVYMDTEATELLDVCTELGQYANVDLYLLISGPTHSQVASWEGLVQIVTTSNVIGSWTIPDGGINVGSGENYIVGHGASPLQPNAVGNIELMSINLTLITAVDPIEIYVSRSPGSLTFEDGPGYAEDAGVIVPCQTSTGGPDYPVFVINPDGGIEVCPIVNNEIFTWGGVKSLYN